ncbi:Protein of unknown function [Bacillus cytotoxicus]|uniref:Uncharacterized protein n=1 Tax=Bacillus cytotoxicus TaxID=580165 RepID=A0AAX2CMI2_9BACI|nr:Protein of unknown function [Bacillus cytotoxicus]
MGAHNQYGMKEAFTN